MSRAIIITSGKGGVGKTTVTANIGTALAFRGKSVVLVEGDIGLNNLDVVMNVEDKVIYDAGEVALGKATVSQCLIKINDKLNVFPATTCATNLVTVEVFKEIIMELKTCFDYVIIDSPAGIEDNFHRAAIGADEGIIVTTPHIPAVRDGYKTVKALYSYGIKNVGLIANRVRGEYVSEKAMLSPDDIAKVLQIPLIGILPEDDFVNLYGLADVGNKKSGIGYSYSLIAGYLDGDDKKIYDCISPYSGVFNRFKRWLNI